MSVNASNARRSSTTTTSRRWFIGAAVVGTVAIVMSPLRRIRRRAAIRAAVEAGGARGLDLVVYKSPACECCGKWVDHVRSAGFAVRVVEQADVTPVKVRLGVPPSAYSCHTATIGEYAVEGHVPAEDIARLLAGRPAIAGLAAPGMPATAPGMDLPGSGYTVVSFTRDGTLTTFATHRG